MAKGQINARQRYSTHGKKRSKRTAKTHVFAVTKHFAMRHDFMHGKGCVAPFAVFPTFQFRVSVAVSQKNTISAI
jgi:hypothetical protein